MVYPYVNLSFFSILLSIYSRPGGEREKGEVRGKESKEGEKIPEKEERRAGESVSSRLKHRAIFVDGRRHRRRPKKSAKKKERGRNT